MRGGVWLMRMPALAQESAVVYNIPMTQNPAPDSYLLRWKGDELAVTQTMTLTWPDVPGDLAPNATAYARCRYALRSLDAIAHGFTSRVSVSAASPQGASAKAEANEVYMLPLDCKNMDNDGCIRLAETTLRMLSEEYIAACQSRSIAQKQTVGRYIRRHPFLCLVSSDVDGILRSLEHKAFAPS